MPDIALLWLARRADGEWTVTLYARDDAREDSAVMEVAEVQGDTLAAACAALAAWVDYDRLALICKLVFDEAARAATSQEAP